MNRKLLIGTIVLSVVVTVTVLVAVLYHQEAGLLTACDTTTTLLDYEGECEPVQWSKSQVPLSVYVFEGSLEPVESSIDFVNDRLGFVMYEMVDTFDAAEVVVKMGIYADVDSDFYRDHNGAVRHARAADGSLRAEIRIWGIATNKILDDVIIHELGHVAGLAHDESQDSAMFSMVSDDSNRLTRLRITDADRATLRQLYSP